MSKDNVYRLALLLTIGCIDINVGGARSGNEQANPSNLEIQSIGDTQSGSNDRTTNLEYVSPQSKIQTPAVQSISGIDKQIEVSGKTIQVSGIRNTVKVLNTEVALIQVSGIDNSVFYPKEAMPQIQADGINPYVGVY